MSGFSKAFCLVLPGALLAALLFTTACGESKSAKAGAPQAMPVKVQTATAQKVDDTTDYVATLKSRDSAVVSPQVEGIITQIFVHSGERVASGAPLMQIDPAKQQATVKSQENARVAQEAQVTWAKQNYERVSGLANAGVVSRQDLDQARATLDNAQAQLQSLGAQVNEQTVQLHYYKVVAPRAGIVGDVPVRVGDRVLVTTQLTTVDRPGKLAKISGIILSHPGLRLEVDGYTDSIGTDAYNLKLSDERAGAVQQYLVQQGLAQDNVTAKGFGKDDPVASNSTASGRQANRRVELVVSGEIIGTQIGPTHSSQ